MHATLFLHHLSRWTLLGNNAKREKTRDGEGERRREKERVPTAREERGESTRHRHLQKAVRLAFRDRREKEGKRSRLLRAGKERQDRWKQREEQEEEEEEEETEEEEGTRTKRRCQRDDETKQRENGFRTILGQGRSPVSSEITMPTRRAFLLSPSHYFSLSLSFLLSACYLL